MSSMVVRYTRFPVILWLFHKAGEGGAKEFGNRNKRPHRAEWLGVFGDDQVTARSPPGCVELSLVSLQNGGAGRSSYRYFPYRRCADLWLRFHPRLRNRRPDAHTRFGNHYRDRSPGCNRSRYRPIQRRLHRPAKCTCT